jgi:hypothetical protein
MPFSHFVRHPSTEVEIIVGRKASEFKREVYRLSSSLLLGHHCAIFSKRRRETAPPSEPASACELSIG